MTISPLDIYLIGMLIFTLGFFAGRAWALCLDIHK